MAKTLNDASLISIRETVSSIETELRTPSGTDTLRTLSRSLIDQLAIEPAVRMRSCPTCSALGMPAASRCGSCWTSLVPEHA